jgi:hypothetical protein
METAMDTDVRCWAAEYLSAKGHEPCPARINAIHDAVVMVLLTGRFGETRSAAVYEQAYEAYGEALAKLCRERGLGRHPHRTIGPGDN